MLDTRGHIIFIQCLCVTSYVYLSRSNILTRYDHLRLHRFCPIFIYTSLYKGAIFTLLIRNISRISTNLNGSIGQLIKNIRQLAVNFTNTIQNFINIMIQVCYPMDFLFHSSYSSYSYKFSIYIRKAPDTRGDIISIPMRYNTKVISVSSSQILPILPGLYQAIIFNQV